VIELSGELHAAGGIDEKRHGDRRAVVALERVDLDGSGVHPDPKVLLLETVDEPALLVEHEDGQKYVLGPGLFGVGRDFLLLRSRLRVLREPGQSRDREHHPGEDALHRQP
jgi:hypothetical protein